MQNLSISNSNVHPSPLLIPIWKKYARWSYMSRMLSFGYSLSSGFIPSGASIGGKVSSIRFSSRALSLSLYSSIAQARLPSRPARPASWKYASMLDGLSVCITSLTSGLSIPIPKALVATITLTLPLCHASCRSSFMAGSSPAW